MADEKSRKGPQDRNRINLSEDYEVRYWSKKFGVTPDDLRAAGLCTKKESRALIERPYSREPQAVGAVYDRPGFFVQSPRCSNESRKLS